MCKWLDAKGKKWLDKSGKPFIDCNKLFVNHHIKLHYGCLKFVEMPVWARKKVCYEASLCMKCLDPGVVYDPAHNATCMIYVDFSATSKKAKFSVEDATLWGITLPGPG